MNAKLSPKMADVLVYAAQHGFQGVVNSGVGVRTVEALTARGLLTNDHNLTWAEDGKPRKSPVITLAGWALLWDTYSIQRPADEGRLTMDEALAEAWTNMGIVTTPVVDVATTNRSVDAYLTREYPLNFPARPLVSLVKAGAPTVDEAPALHRLTGADPVSARVLVSSARAYKSSTGEGWWSDPADGLATVNAWLHRAQSGVWTVDGTTYAVRTDAGGRIRGAVIVLETAGSKFPQPVGG